MLPDPMCECGVCICVCMYSYRGESCSFVSQEEIMGCLEGSETDGNLGLNCEKKEETLKRNKWSRLNHGECQHS